MLDGLAERFDQVVVRIYAETLDLSTLFSNLNQLEAIIAKLAAMRDALASHKEEDPSSTSHGPTSGASGSRRRSGSYGSPPPRSDTHTEAEVWEYFGFTNLAPGERPPADRVKAAWRKRVKNFHPDLATKPSQKQEAETRMKELNDMYDRARRYLGTKVDQRV